MKKPDARQWALIYECGCNPDHYLVIGEEPGWIYTVHIKKQVQVHFDLNRKMPCYTGDSKIE